MISKRKKNTRLRGSKTHGWGAMKKHRGTGNRGGKGMAGSGKRGDSKKESVLKLKNYFGKHGFTTKRRTFITSANIKSLEDKILSLVAEGRAQKKGDMFIINLSVLGADKLIAKGKPTRKYQVTCMSATAGAIEAIKNAGGEVIVQEAESSEASEE